MRFHATKEDVQHMWGDPQGRYHAVNASNTDNLNALLAYADEQGWVPVLYSGGIDGERVIFRKPRFEGERLS